MAVYSDTKKAGQIAPVPTWRFNTLFKGKWQGDIKGDWQGAKKD